MSYVISFFFLFECSSRWFTQNDGEVTFLLPVFGVGKLWEVTIPFFPPLPPASPGTDSWFHIIRSFSFSPSLIRLNSLAAVEGVRLTWHRINGRNGLLGSYPEIGVNLKAKEIKMMNICMINIYTSRVSSMMLGIYCYDCFGGVSFYLFCLLLAESPGFRTVLSVSHQFSCSVVSDSLRPHGLQHARPPCPSPPTPGVYSDSCPLSQWCHPTIS